MKNTKKTPTVEAGANDQTHLSNSVKSQGNSNKQAKLNQSNDGFKLIGINDLLKEPEPLEWLVDDYILQGTQVQLVGASGLGKTFLAVDLALSVASGKHWNSRNVKQGPVAYINAEGHTGFQHRVKGWHEKNQPTDNLPFCLSNGPVDMMNTSNINSLTKHLDKFAAKHDGYIAIIFVDTLRRNMSGNEDDSKDVSMFMNNFENLCKRYRATGFVVHHPGHNNTGRARGSSSQKAALDTALLLKEEKKELGLICTKLKDGGAIPNPVGYQLEVITIPWLDSKGNYITTCVPRYDKNTNVGSKSLSPMPFMVRLCIESLNSAFKGPLDTNASIDDWKYEFSSARLDKDPNATENAIKKAFNRSKSKLLQKGVVVKGDDGNYKFGNDIDPPWSGMRKLIVSTHFKDSDSTKN